MCTRVCASGNMSICSRAYFTSKLLISTSSIFLFSKPNINAFCINTNVDFVSLINWLSMPERPSVQILDAPNDLCSYISGSHKKRISSARVET